MKIKVGQFGFDSGLSNTSKPVTISGGVSTYKTNAIDITRESDHGNFNLWSTVIGDLGQTGASVSITWEGCYLQSGATYITPSGTNKIRTSGTSKTGPDVNGTDAGTFTPDIFPFMKIIVKHDSSASTNTAVVLWALIFD